MIGFAHSVTMSFE